MRRGDGGAGVDARFGPAIKLQIEGRQLHLRVSDGAQPLSLLELALSAGVATLAAIGAAEVQPQFRLDRRGQHPKLPMDEINRSRRDRRQRDIEDVRDVGQTAPGLRRALSHFDRFDQTAVIDELLSDPSPFALGPAGRDSRHWNSLMAFFFKKRHRPILKWTE